MKKLVIVFPEVEFLTYSDPKIIDKYNHCIRKRYLLKGFHPFVVNYENSKGFYNFLNKTPINSGIPKATNPDFTKTINSLDIQKNDKIVVCGFHCFDCVYKLANEIYKLNKNIVIDSDLTDLFPSVIKQKNFNVEKFNPNSLLINTINAWTYKNYLPSTLKQKLLKRYSNPVWGVSKKYLKKLSSNKNEL